MASTRCCAGRATAPAAAVRARRALPQRDVHGPVGAALARRTRGCRRAGRRSRPGRRSAGPAPAPRTPPPTPGGRLRPLRRAPRPSAATGQARCAAGRGSVCRRLLSTPPDRRAPAPRGCRAAGARPARRATARRRRHPPAAASARPHHSRRRLRHHRGVTRPQPRADGPRAQPDRLLPDQANPSGDGPVERPLRAGSRLDGSVPARSRAHHDGPPADGCGSGAVIGVLRPLHALGSPPPRRCRRLGRRGTPAPCAPRRRSPTARSRPDPAGPAAGRCRTAPARSPWCPSDLRDRPQAIVAALAAAELDPQLPVREVELVVDGDHLRRRAPCRTGRARRPGRRTGSCTSSA